MKPKPFSALNHFTVPCATCAPTFSRDGRPLLIGGPGFCSSARQNERGTRPARKGTTRKPGKQVLQAEPICTFCDVVPRSGDGLSDEAGLPSRLERRADAVGGSDDRLQRVEGLQALAGVEDDGLLVLVE